LAAFAFLFDLLEQRQLTVVTLSSTLYGRKSHASKQSCNKITNPAASGYAFITLV